MNINEITENIYVINLKERSDRKIHIESELKKINCEKYKLIEGVNGNLIDNPTRLKNGMFGLITTYLKIYEDWSKNDCDDIMIIEDDCLFVNDFNEKIKVYFDNVPSDWDMLYFGANHNYHMGMKTLRVNDKCIKLNKSYSAHCVLLKKQVFEELIENIKNFSIENDVMMANLQNKYNAYSSSEALATQIESYSNIENKIVNYDWLIK
jgi:GR25 family glycosyltransferase involved in LPS biosynthesis